MFYTVLHKSGWQSDMWQVGKTFSQRRNADEYVNAMKSAAPRDSWYNAKVVAHRKPVSNYTTDGERYRFGGVRAVA